MGTNTEVIIQGSSYVENESRVVYVPGVIVPFTSWVNFSTISNSQPKTITWTPDPQNMFHKILIQVSYYSSFSRLYNPSFPVSIQGLQYTVDDNGSFTIPAADLARFPAGTYIDITISRGTNIENTNTKVRIQYFAVVTGRTPPLLVVP